MTDHHKFRYLLAPGSKFQFVRKFRIWLVISGLLMAISVASLFWNKARHGQYMNWTIDFKGGTEIIFAFKDKASGDYTKVDPAKLRAAFAKAGEKDMELSDYSFTQSTPKGDVTVNGTMVRSPRFSAIQDATKEQADTALSTTFKDRSIGKEQWSGDRLFVRSMKPITDKEAAPVFAKLGLELKQWKPEDAQLYSTPDKETGEYNEVFAIWGLDRQYQKTIEAAFPKVEALVQQSYGVGAKAGDKLRNDAAKSIVFALFLIMLYLAFRFDVRYAPGAAFATVHDAVMVIGVFSITWTSVSLVSVAGLLTVMGYSTNDTVIVFDRIRENQAKLKDKKIERIVDISLNEMLSRTILTSSTVFATTLIMNIFGTGDVANFAFAMNVGVIVGTYSSIFLASPIFMFISRKWYSGPPKKPRIPPKSTMQREAELPPEE